MRVMSYTGLARLLAWLLVGSVVANGSAQTPGSSSSPIDQSAAQMAQRMEAISSALAATQQQLEQSQQQMQRLQQELLLLRQQMASNASVVADKPTVGESSSVAGSSSVAAQPAADGSVPLEDRLQALEAAVKLHDQTKVESGSKYPVRINGLILFNGFLNNGLTDSIDQPTVALRQSYNTGNGSVGGSLRQTILGIEGYGPRVAGARTSAHVEFDFSSGFSDDTYGTASGVVRMRTGSVNLDWENDSVQFGMVAPLISPLLPSSYATVAQPSLAGAGNLWTWAPQLRYTHRLPLQDGKRVQLELGLRDSPAAGYISTQVSRPASPGELSKQPAYESRISYGGSSDRRLQLGIGGYYSRQSYSGYGGYGWPAHADSWAFTADWHLPFTRRFELSGEGYRGRSIGGLGGGVYKDLTSGFDPVTGAVTTHRLNAAGGWTQFKTRFGQSLESNVSIGLDDGFAHDFHVLTLSPSATATQLRARNRMAVANLIFRLKTYLILSPEYRRIWTWPITGSRNMADVYTLSIGYQF